MSEQCWSFLVALSLAPKNPILARRFRVRLGHFSYKFSRFWALQSTREKIAHLYCMWEMGWLSAKENAPSMYMRPQADSRAVCITAPHGYDINVFSMPKEFRLIFRRARCFAR